jgi:hypothetical protein
MKITLNFLIMMLLSVGDVNAQMVVVTYVGHNQEWGAHIVMHGDILL